MLAVTGELDLDGGRPGRAMRRSRGARSTRKVMRNTRDPLLDVFERPTASPAPRSATPPPRRRSRCCMINSHWSLDRAPKPSPRGCEGELRRTTSALVTDAYRLAFGREPSRDEREAARGFPRRAGAADRRAQAGVAKPRRSSRTRCPSATATPRCSRPARTQERLDDSGTAERSRAATSPSRRSSSLESHLRHAARCGPSPRSGTATKGTPGWSLGVTGKGSRCKPQTLVLQLAGEQPRRDKDPVEPRLLRPAHRARQALLRRRRGRPRRRHASRASPSTLKDLSNDDEPLLVVNGRAHSHRRHRRATLPLRHRRPWPSGATQLVRRPDRRRAPLRGAAAAEQLLFTSDRQ